MIRKFCRILGACALLFATTNAYSDGFGIGVSASLLDVNASGKHTLRTTGVETTGGADNRTAIGEIFAEYTWNNITLGVSHVPGGADVSDKIRQRDDTDYTDGSTTAGTAVSNKAQASHEDHYTYYLEYPIYETFYAKLGYVQVDLITTESLGTGSTYGNETLDGITAGFGVRSDVSDLLFMKVEVNMTDYDDFKLTSSGSNTVKGDVDTKGLKLAVGFNF